jgi:hypothetical protein
MTGTTVMAIPIPMVTILAAANEFVTGIRYIFFRVLIRSTNARSLC